MSESILISTISQTAMQQKILVNHSSSVITTLKFLSLFPYKQLHKQQCNKRFGYIIHHMWLYPPPNTNSWVYTHINNYTNSNATKENSQIPESVPKSTINSNATKGFWLIIYHTS